MIMNFIKLTILLSLLISCSSAFAQLSLKGIRTYTFDEKGQEIEKNSYYPNGELEQFVHYSYDIAGHKTGTLKYDKDSSLIVRYIYINDEEGNRIKTQKIDYEKNKNTSKRLTYNSENLLDTTYYFDEYSLSKFMVCTWDDEGLLQSRRYYTPQGIFISESNFKYKVEAGNILEKHRYDSNERLQSTLTYTYNNQGQKITINSRYTSTRRTDKFREYQFNACGQCIKSFVYEITK